MEKTTVYLTTQQKAALEAAAREQGRSEARLIRDGIDGVLSDRSTRERQTALYGEELADAELGAGAAFPARPRWVGREAFVRQFAAAQADSALAAELRDLAPDLTDELLDQ